MILIFQIPNITQDDILFVNIDPNDENIETKACDIEVYNE